MTSLLTFTAIQSINTAQHTPAISLPNGTACNILQSENDAVNFQILMIKSIPK